MMRRKNSRASSQHAQAPDEHRTSDTGEKSQRAKVGGGGRFQLLTLKQGHAVVGACQLPLQLLHFVTQKSWMRKAEAVLLAKQCKSWTYLAHDEPENANLFVTTESPPARHQQPMQRRHDHKVKDFPKNSYKSIYHNPSDQSDLQVFHLPCITDAAGYTGLHLLMLTGTYGLLKLQWEQRDQVLNTASLRRAGTQHPSGSSRQPGSSSCCVALCTSPSTRSSSPDASSIKSSYLATWLAPALCDLEFRGHGADLGSQQWVLHQSMEANKSKKMLMALFLLFGFTQLLQLGLITF
ncbi:MAG: hypothetical protein FRX49_00222 [Trebouxia sp. A1-2]|nr:MAG: hypothetical protein FRX49_00222 [Trebouxia sp. A1-2]